jgi:hypothetical protein
MLQCLGLSEDTATYLAGTCDIDSLDKIANLDGVNDVDTTIKGVANPERKVTAGSGSTAPTSHKNVIPVSIRDATHLKLCVYYLKHMERVQRKPVVNTINLTLVCSFNKTTEGPLINDKDCPGTLETIKEYLASQYGGMGATLDYVVRPDIAVKTEAENHVEGYDNVDQEMTCQIASHRKILCG